MNAAKRVGADAAGRLIALLLATTLWGFSHQAQAEPVRVGVLKFGTVAWELEVIKHHGLDRKAGFELEVVPFASTQATKVGLQAGALDVIVSDWFWVSRQRAAGAEHTFAPYSRMVGALLAAGDAPIRNLADLKGKRLGIAGGPLDKSWLLLQALARRDLGLDPPNDMEVVFAAPPLLNEEIRSGRLDAVLNFWHFTARLEAAGLRRVSEVEEITRALGIDAKVPLIGYVFDEAWGNEHRDTLLGFFRFCQDLPCRPAVGRMRCGGVTSEV